MSIFSQPCSLNVASYAADATCLVACIAWRGTYPPAVWLSFLCLGCEQMQTSAVWFQTAFVFCSPHSNVVALPPHDQHNSKHIWIKQSKQPNEIKQSKQENDSKLLRLTTGHPPSLLHARVLLLDKILTSSQHKYHNLATHHKSSTLTPYLTT